MAHLSVPSRLVGRSNELERLHAAWEESHGGLRVVAVLGESGIGKTRLVDEFLASVGRDARVLTGRCGEFLDVAHRPFIEMLRSDCGDHDGEELLRRLGQRAGDLIRLLTESGAEPQPGTDPSLERHRLLEAITGWLATAAASDRVCLFIDDLQWADADTLATLEHLLDECVDLPMLVVVTCREHEASPNEERVARLLRPANRLRRLPLAGLDRDDVATLVELEVSALTEATLHRIASVADRVHEAAGGNPLFVLELARQYAADPDVGAGPLTTLPDGLLDAIRQRAARLPDDVRSCLQVAAVLGREFEPAVLAEVTGMAANGIDHCLTIGAARSLVEEHGSAPLRFRFCHDAVRTALYAAWGPLQRAELHHRIAGVLARHHAGSDTEGVHLALGHHLGRATVAGSAREASRHLARAAELSAQRRAHATAAQRYRRAEELLGPEAPVDERCALMIARGIAEFHAGLPVFRGTLLEAAREAARTGHVDHLVQAVVANHRGWYSSTVGVDRERVELIALALLRCPVDDLAARARLNAMWAMENVRDPDERDRVLARSVEAVQLAEEAGDPHLLIDILCDRFSVMYASFENPHGCVALARRIESLARASGDEGHLLNAAIAVAQSTMLIGDFTTSDEALLLSEALATRVHRPVRLWLARVWIATRTAMRGNVARAEELASAAYELGAALDQPDALTWFAGQLYGLRYLEDRTAELIDAIEEQVAEHAAAVPAWQAGLAFTLASAGREAEAEQIVKEFVSSGLANLPQDMLRLQGLAFLASAVVRLGDADAAHAVYAELAPYAGMFAHNGTIDAGPVDLHLGSLAATFGDIGLARGHCTTAARQCDAAGARAWRVHVDRWLGTLAASPGSLACPAAVHHPARPAGHHLAEGRHHWYAGDRGAARTSFDLAWHQALADDDMAQAARAAIGPELPIGSAGQALAEQARRCAEVLEHLDPQESTLRVQVVLTMAAAQWRGDRRAARELVDQARGLAMAVAPSDPGALLAIRVGEALIIDPQAPLGPRVATARALVEEVAQQENRWLANAAYFVLLSALLEAGEIAALDAELSWRSVLLTRMPFLMPGPVRGRFRCARALLDGDTEGAASLAAELLAEGEAAGDPDSVAVWITHSAIIAWQRGDAAAFEPLFLRARQEEPDEALWPASLGWARLAQGRHDAARAVLDQLPPVEQILGDRNGLATLTVLAEVAHIKGDRDQMQRLYDVLVPYVERVVPIGAGVAFWGTVAKTLGLLAEGLGLFDEAHRHLATSATLCLRVGAQPWLVEAQLALAAFGARTRRGDIDVAGLADQALAGAQRLGLTALAAQAAELTAGRLTDPSPVGVGAAEVRATPRVSGQGVMVRVLGGFGVEAADGSVPRWTSRKARTLLKVLVAKQGVAVRRETLMDLLWPDQDPSRLANRFSVALATVRRALDPGRQFPTDHHVEMRDDLLRLNVDAIRTDLDQFHVLAVGHEIAELRRAIELYRGDAFADEVEAEWAAGVREQARVAFCHAATKLAALEAQRAEHPAAAALFRRVLEVDPFHDAANRGLVETLQAMGAHGQARVLAEEFEARLTELTRD
ncbi:AAA family ATPase [Nocardioides sp. AE5]|uniref:AAA family ATPase n=1 Tax=Nocardioides sp. AE5 TaxID=2962573 RepID=UPI00288219FC|nr:AAA family ATPase [Nocardioides sp. AE5]MDT0200380.1 AAA family ATPase [Nocardioides sp. AE5]